VRSSSSYVGIALLAISVAAYATWQAKAATLAPKDACALLTKEAAKLALGEDVTGPESKSGLEMGPGTTASTCGYAGSGLQKVRLNLIQMSPDVAAMYQAMCAQKDHTGLVGLGDIACWYNDKHEELQALQGTTFISIEMSKKGNPTEVIKGVMKNALARLGDSGS
jgi:hypothetical protein